MLDLLALIARAVNEATFIYTQRRAREKKVAQLNGPRSRIWDMRVSARELKRENKSNGTFIYYIYTRYKMCEYKRERRKSRATARRIYHTHRAAILRNRRSRSRKLYSAHVRMSLQLIFACATISLCARKFQADGAKSRFEL